LQLAFYGTEFSTSQDVRKAVDALRAAKLEKLL
jgi:hypothetical protein